PPVHHADGQAEEAEGAAALVDVRETGGVEGVPNQGLERGEVEAGVSKEGERSADGALNAGREEVLVEEVMLEEGRELVAPPEGEVDLVVDAAPPEGAPVRVDVGDPVEANV